MELYELDRDSSIPLYYQIEDILRDKIKNNVWSVGETIPTEDELCEMFNVSKGPVRQAIQNLVDEGRLKKKRRVGTFVCKPKIQDSVIMESKEGIFQSLEHSGLNVSVNPLEMKIITGSEKIRNKMQFSQDTKLLRTKRLLLGNNQPFALVQTYLPAKRFSELSINDLKRMSIQRLAIEKYNVKISLIDEQFQAINLDENVAKHLDTHAGSAALLVKRLVYDKGIPYDYSLMTIRGDSSFYKMQMVPAKKNGKRLTSIRLA